MLVSGASAKPARRLQRRRARISERKRRTLAATGPGGLPARTCSKCLRDRSFSPLRKNARASSRRTRTRSGRSISMARSEAMASSSSASRSSPARSGCCDAPVAARPMRKSTFASTAPALGQRPQDAQRLLELAAPRSASWVFQRRQPRRIWLEAGGGGCSSSALHAGAESRREAAAARARRRGLIVMPATLEGCSRDKKEGGKTCHPLAEAWVERIRISRGEPGPFNQLIV